MTESFSRRGPRGAAALAADLSVFPLAAVLDTLHATSRSGVLVYRHRDQHKRVWFRRGEIVFADSNHPMDRLGECLLRAGVLSHDGLARAEAHHRPPARFGKGLVELGLLTPRELWNGVRHQVEEIVRSLFATPGGEVVFYDGPDEPDNVVRLSLATSRLVQEGLRRREELRAFLDVLGDSRVLLEPGEHRRAPLTADESALVGALADGAPFAFLCEAAGLDPEAGARAVQQLRGVGALRLVRRESSDRDDGLRDTVAEVAGRAAKQIGGLVDAIAAVEAADAITERLDRVLAEVTARFPALLTGIRLGRRGGLDPDLLAERAARLPGGEEALAEALAELRAYLEFEVHNHPGIEDPAAVVRSCILSG